MPNNHKSSPLLGWLTAGADLISAQLESTATTVSKKIDETHSSIEAMQRKGAEVEGELKQRLNPVPLFDSAQHLVMSTPLFSLLSGGKARVKREQQIELLSAKVDLLVEQVALLAAKRAAEKAKTPIKAPAKAAPKSTTKAAPKSTAKATPNTASKSAPKSAGAATKTRGTASKATAAKKAPSATKSTSTASTASKPAVRKASTGKASEVKPQAAKSAASNSSASTLAKTSDGGKTDSDS